MCPKKLGPSPGYYRSAVGLDRSHNFRHIFRDSLAVLSCRLCHELESPLNPYKTQLKGGGWRFYIPPPPKVRKILSRAVAPRDAPPEFKHFIEERKTGENVTTTSVGSRKYVGLVSAIRKIKQIYRIGPHLMLVLASIYKRPIQVVENLVGPDKGLPYFVAQAIDEETVYSFAARKEFFWLRENLKYLERVRVCFDALCLFLQIERRRGKFPPRETLRWISRSKWDMLADPLSFAQTLKELAFLARQYWFGGKKSDHPLINYLDDQGSLQFSYIARSLPSPETSSEDESEMFDAFKSRLTQLPPDEDPEWRPFVKRFLLETYPGELKVSMVYSQPSNSAALGYKRSNDGHLQAYQDYILLGFANHTWELEPPPVIRDVTSSGRASTGVVFENEGIHSHVTKDDPIGMDFIPNPKITYREMNFIEDEEIIDLFKDCKFTDPVLQETLIANNQYELMCFERLMSDDTNKTAGYSPEELEKVLADEENRKVHFSTRIVKDQFLLAAYYNDFMKLTVFDLLRRLPCMIVQPIFAPEKGLKVRVPTRTLTAFNLVLQPLRKAADAHLLKFPPASASLGGELDVDLGDEGPYYSLDLSVATDQHPFWLTLTFYEELINLHPELECFREFLPKLFGPHYVLEREPICSPPPPPVLTYKDQQVGLANVMGVWLDTPYLPKREGNFDIPFALTYAALRDWAKRYEAWALSLYDLPGFYSTQGAMMGNPTSWAVLPLVTAFGCEAAGIRKFKTWGDDALLPQATPSRVSTFDNKITSVGAVISKQKSFLHKDRGLFTEVPTENNKPIPYTMLSYWVAPNGGSKGQVDWYNLPDAFAGRLQADLGRLPSRRDLRNKGLFNYTKFYYLWRYAEHLGLPLGAPSIMGGIGHPTCRRSPSRMHDKWSAYLCSRRVIDLATKGGLSLIPKRGKALNKNPAFEYMAEHAETLISTKEFPTGQQGTSSYSLKDTVSLLENPSSMLAVFHKGFQRDFKTPSVTNVSEKFWRRLHTQKRLYKDKKLLNFSSSGLERDLRGKLDRYVHIPREILFKFRDRPFGMFTSERAPPMDLSTGFNRG